MFCRVGYYKLIEGFPGMYDGWSDTGLDYTYLMHKLQMNISTLASTSENSAPYGEGYQARRRPQEAEYHYHNYDYNSVDRVIMAMNNDIRLFNLKGEFTTLISIYFLLTTL